MRVTTLFTVTHVPTNTLSACIKHFALHISKSLHNIHGLTAGSACHCHLQSLRGTLMQFMRTHIHTSISAMRWLVISAVFSFLALLLRRFGKCLYCMKHFSFLNRLPLRVYIVRLCGRASVHMLARSCTFCHFNCL